MTPPGGQSLRRRLRRALSLMLITTGALMLADVAVTLIWQEPVSALVALLHRPQVERSYRRYADRELSAAQRTQLARLGGSDARIAYLARREQAEVPNGAALGRITIPQIGVSYYVVQGTDGADLQLGPGHYPSTALPGLGRTVAIAGHRTTYLAPFRNINELRRGSLIELQMPYGRFTYAVQRTRVVAANAWWIAADHGLDRLVLSACTPLYSATQRIVVFATLRSEVPLGAAA